MGYLKGYALGFFLGAFFILAFEWLNRRGAAIWPRRGVRGLEPDRAWFVQ